MLNCKLEWIEESTKEELIERFSRIYLDPKRESNVNRYGKLYMKKEHIELLVDRMLSDGNLGNNKYQEAYLGEVDAKTLKERIQSRGYDEKAREKRLKKLTGMSKAKIDALHKKDETEGLCENLRETVGWLIENEGIFGAIKELEKILEELKKEQQEILIKLYGSNSMKEKA